MSKSRSNEWKMFLFVTFLIVGLRSCQQYEVESTLEDRAPWILEQLEDEYHEDYGGYDNLHG